MREKLPSRYALMYGNIEKAYARNGKIRVVYSYSDNIPYQIMTDQIMTDGEIIELAVNEKGVLLTVEYSR